MCRKLGEIHNKRPDDFLNSMYSLPVDIVQILESLKIDTAAVSFEKLQKDLPLNNNKITGLAYAKGDDLFILYSKELSMPESRFTLAHELAHCCMHMNVDSSFHLELQTISDVLNVSQDRFLMFNRRKEEEADKFARDLLIPTDALLLLLKKESSLSLKQLANFFLVPTKQIQIKLTEL